MEVLDLIGELFSPIMSIIAVLISCFKKGGVKNTKTLEQIKAEAEAKNKAFIEKSCKKNNIKLGE